MFEIPEWIPDGQRGPADLAETQVTIEEVFRLVDQLPEAQREVILLRFGAGLNIAETAEALDKRQGNVKVLQHKAVKRLRSMLLQEASTATMSNSGNRTETVENLTGNETVDA